MSCCVKNQVLFDFGFTNGNETLNECFKTIFIFTILRYNFLISLADHSSTFLSIIFSLLFLYICKCFLYIRCYYTKFWNIIGLRNVYSRGKSNNKLQHVYRKASRASYILLALIYSIVFSCIFNQCY